MQEVRKQFGALMLRWWCLTSRARIELAFGEDYLENEFDPAEHDRKMASMFNEDYYEGVRS